MKNKKWTLAKVGLVIMSIVITNYLCMMWYEIIKNGKLLSGWAGLIITIVAGILGILSAFGAFNSVDKKTMVKAQSDQSKQM